MINPEPPIYPQSSINNHQSYNAPSPFQHRKHFDEDKLKELVANIQREGLIEPIVVRPNEGHYFEKTFQVVTVSVKPLCYNGPKYMKSAIRNPKSKMEGPYLSNAYAKVNLRPLKNVQFWSRSRKAKISTTGIY